MKILITGASGFIGGFLIEEAFAKGWEVWAGIRKTSNKTYLNHPNLHFIHLDYAHTDVLLQQIKTHVAENGSWDYIIHNAGITKCTIDSDYYLINHVYTVHFINALLESGCMPRKFLFMSSMGSVGPGDEYSGVPIKMSDKPNPVSAYGRSKLLAENFIQSIPDFPFIILRPTGVYGPRERDYFVMLKMIKSGFDLAVGFKQQKLNFIYVKDLIQVSYAALESPLLRKTWFVADGDIYTSKAFSELVKDVLQKKRLLTIRVPLSLVQMVASISGSFSRVTGKPTLLNPDKFQVMKQRNWTCDASELEQDLNFKPAYNLRKGMEETINWYKENGWL